MRAWDIQASYTSNMKTILRFGLFVFLLLVVAVLVVQVLASRAIDDLLEQAATQQRPLQRWHDSWTELEGGDAFQAMTGGSMLDDENRVPVIFVGNNWQGTITVISLDDYRKLGVIDGIPDKLERLREIDSKFFYRLMFFAIRMAVGEGHDQYVDDMYSSIDGRLLVVSRPSFADVVAINTRTGEIAWRFPVDGRRADHMALSPDGRFVAVSASTADKVHVIEVDTGREHASFPTGDSPHENVYSKDGKHLFHASIGNVFSPLDLAGGGLLKGNRVFQVVNTADYSVELAFDIREKLDAAGLEDLSPAIRPMAHTDDEKNFYFQLSFLHGLVEYDLPNDSITRVIELPKVTTLPRTSYVNDSAHHGLAISGDNRKLCVAGTMDDYVAIVDRETEAYELLPDLGEKPYWAVTSKSGDHCYISWSETDTMSVIDFESATEVVRIDVGDHPQRIREGYLISPVSNP
ncbi:MAG: serine/threonine protein kinase [Pseudomonadota bacterium]